MAVLVHLKYHQAESGDKDKAFRSIASNASNFPPRRPNTQQPRRVKTCTLCKAAGRKSAGTHWLRECSFLPDANRKALARARFLQDIDFTDDDEYQYDDPINDGTPARDVADVMDPSVIHNPLIDKLTPTRRVSIIQSPFLRVHYGHHPVTLTLDCGATTNMISATTASRLGLPIKPATQATQQADGITPLSVTGETHIIVSRGRFDFALDALVVRELDVDILAGTPFMTQNDVAIRPAKKQIILKGLEVVTYGTSSDGDNLTRVRRSKLSCSGPQTNSPLFCLESIWDWLLHMTHPPTQNGPWSPDMTQSRAAPVCFGHKPRRSYL